MKDEESASNNFYAEVVHKMNPSHLLKENRKFLRKERSKHISKLRL